MFHIAVGKILPREYTFAFLLTKLDSISIHLSFRMRISPTETGHFPLQIGIKMSNLMLINQVGQGVQNNGLDSDFYLTCFILLFECNLLDNLHSGVAVSLLFGGWLLSGC